MEIEPRDILLVYLLENDSFEMADQKEVSSSLTRDAALLRSGINKDQMDDILQESRSYISVKKKKITRRKNPAECLFLNSKGVLRAKELIHSIEDKRVDYIDERDERKNLKISEVKREMANFDIPLTILDLFLMARRGNIIDINTFLLPEGWKEKLFSDHAFPEMVFISNTSCIPFGGIFTTFGEKGIILPVNRRVEVGIHEHGSGEVIRWMKRHESNIFDAYYISGKRGFETLVSGHSSVKDRYGLYSDRGIFKDEAEFKEYFDTLLKYDYSIIFDHGTGHGISIAGHVGAILATIAIHSRDDRSFPFNCQEYDGKNARMKDGYHIPVWDLPPLSEPGTIGDLIQERHPEKGVCESCTNQMLKFITLSQVFETHWNTFFPDSEAEKINNFKKTFGMKEYSSGSACISSIFASPILFYLGEDNTVSMDSVIYPEISRNQFMGLLIDRMGGIDNPKEEFMNTFKRFYPLITIDQEKTLAYLNSLKTTSGSLAKLASRCILEDQSFTDTESNIKRQAITALMTSQRGIYETLGISNRNYKELHDIMKEKAPEIGLSPVGVGNSGTYIFCIQDLQNVHTLRMIVDSINKDRPEGQNIEIVLHGPSHSYIFNSDPLIVIRK